MKLLTRIFSILSLSLVFYACESHNDYSSQLEETSETTSQGDAETIPLSSTAATHQPKGQNFIRKADLLFEVENVYQSTTKIEQNISNIGGFVEQSNLSTTIVSSEIFPIDTEKAKKIDRYFAQNEMTIRIPQATLNDFLISLGNEIQFLNHRTISAENVDLNLIFNELEKNRISQTTQKLNRLAQDSGKLSSKTEIVNQAEQQQFNLNQNKISQLKTNYEVAYSTVKLTIYEQEKVSESLTFNAKSYTDIYKPSLIFTLGQSFKSGFELFLDIAFGLISIWPIWVIIGVIFYVFRRFKNKSNSLKN